MNQTLRNKVDNLKLSDFDKGRMYLLTSIMLKVNEFNSRNVNSQIKYIGILDLLDKETDEIQQASLNQSKNV